MHAEFYCPSMKPAWDDFVRHSRNATFLFYRDFMDYHQERFCDASLVFLNDRAQVVGLFPANIVREENTIVSHGGLTYGGFILNKKTTLKEVGCMMQEMAKKYLALSVTQLIYKPVPHIYHQYPSEEAEYWLFRAAATLTARGAAQVIDLQHPLPFSQLRYRKTKKAAQQDIAIQKATVTDLPSFWKILSTVLQDSHGVNPVHSIDEIQLLMQTFPENIQLYIVKHRDTGAIIAGTLLFDHLPVRHAQYIAASAEGKQWGALDLLFELLIEQSRQEGFRYFDFGISTEKQGTWLNEGLTFQKEGLGGRTITYDAYTVKLENLLNL